MTLRLFDDDVRLMEFQATVTKAGERNGRAFVELDQTCFYPESGGQPCDLGWLNESSVTNVIEENGSILHFLDNPLETGITVNGRIDANRRSDHMQQHSGQHILSKAFIEMAGAETIGFHLGQTDATIDLNVPPPDPQILTQVEDLANRIVRENRPIHIQILSRKEAALLPVRKLPENETSVRIVEVEQFDWNGCCGTHVRQTGEIGLIKIVRSEKYKQGSRITFLCGERALKDYQQKGELLQKITREFSVGESDLLDKMMQMREQAQSASKQIKSLNEKMIGYLIPELLEQAERCGNVRIVQTILNDLPVKEAQSMANRLIEEENLLVILGLDLPAPQLILARSKNLNLDLKPAFEKSCSILDGKGGGPPCMLTCAGKNNRLNEAVQTASEFLKTSLPV